MDIDERATALRGRPPDARARRGILSALMLASLGACQPEPASVEAGKRATATVAGERPAPVPSSADLASPAARVAGDDPDAFPPPKDADPPPPTTAASSADANSTASGAPILRAVRVGKHAGHDRLVFEFTGQGLPAWRVEYVERPVTDCGAGQTVPVAGEAWLQIRFSGAQAHTPAGQSTSGPARRAVNQPTLRELVRTCDFEAEVTWVAGLASPAPYTPRVLAAPSRLVIDIAH